jgi:hypothetical protein
MMRVGKKDTKKLIQKTFVNFLPISTVILNENQ